MELEKARTLANELAGVIASQCHRVEIAGSIRRGRVAVKDIEIVAAPRPDKTLFMEDDFIGPILRIDKALRPFGKLLMGQNRMRKYDLGEIKLDLFIVSPPQQWGVIYTIRTGPAEFSHYTVTKKKYGGPLPDYMRIDEGALWKNDELVPTPEEIDYLNAVGVGWVEPCDRLAYVRSHAAWMVKR